MEKTNSTFWMGISIIWLSHLFMDFMIGIWVVYKTIAQIDLIKASLITSVCIFIGEGLQLYFGYLSDRGYQQKLLVLGIGLTAAVAFLSYIENEWLIFALILCTFIGSGAFHPSGTNFVMAGNSTCKSMLIAIFACGGMIGAATSQMVYTFLYYHFEGHVWFLSLPIFLCALICACFSFPKEEQSKQQANFKDILQSLKIHRLKLSMLYIVHLLLQIVVMSFAFLLPDILMIKGYETWFCLGGGYGCFIMGSILTSIPIGYCVDKVGYRLVLMAIVIASISFLYLFLGLETLSLTMPMLILLLLGGTMGVIIPVVVAGGVQNIPAYTRSFVSALYMGGTICIAGFGPTLASLLASFFGEQGPIIALQGLSLLFLCALGLIYYLPDTFKFQKKLESLQLASALQEI